MVATAGKLRVLALSVDIGAGHRMAAEAVFRAIEQRRPGSEWRLVEALDYLGPGIGKLTQDVYFQVLDGIPELWGAVYQNKRLAELLRPVGELVDSQRVQRDGYVFGFTAHIIG